MKNVIILGSGRSGTSLVAGCLSGAGYYMGANLLPANDSNPKGFFEDVEINAINEDILEPFAPSGSSRFDRFIPRYTTYRFQRWLLSLPGPVDEKVTPEVARKIARQTDHGPFCFKDPRFCYTLPQWKSFLSDVVYIVVFRNPSKNGH